VNEEKAAKADERYLPLSKDGVEYLALQEDGSYEVTYENGLDYRFSPDVEDRDEINGADKGERIRGTLVDGWLRVNKRFKVKEEVAAATAPQTPETPPMPEMKLSQILPMVAMMGLQKFDLEKMGYVRHVEIGYVVVQVICFAILFLIYTKVKGKPDGGAKIKIPEVKQMGQVVSPACEQTPKEYDMAKVMEAMKQPVMGMVITCGIYYKWGTLLPLMMQLLMTPLTLYETPLFRIYILGKEMPRPFPVPAGPFDALMPKAPAPTAEVADKKAK
jgi:hypothetical protein